MVVVRGLPDYYYPAVAGSKPQGRYVEVVPFKAERLGELADKVLTSPYGDGYSFTTSNEWVQMQTGGEHVGACLQRHLEAGERCARSEEHTSELQSLMRISYAVFCLKKKKNNNTSNHTTKVY